MWRQLELLVALAGLSIAATWGIPCDGTCSGHGACDLTTGRCQCFPGYIGTTCKWQSCPRGVAWADYATATDVAHGLAECSNMGLCDRTTGACRCRDGFEGVACERMSCPPCVNGRCISMRDAAALQDNVNFFTKTTYDAWDADKIFGCQCDNGFTGWDCSLRECPKGDDPMTTGQVNEVQHLNCLCDGCSGTFALTFRRRTTRNLSPTETAASLKAALEALDTISGVAVSVSGSGSTICDVDGATTSITFTNNPGNLPDLQIQGALTGGNTAPVLTLSSGAATGVYDGVGAAQHGTREELYCSNRGVCDFNVGVCVCALGFSSSDGAGGPGTRGDCGNGVATMCPTTSNGVCDGKGTCSNAPLWACSCQAGFTGADCTQRTCPQGTAWFDGATAPNTAHAMAPCSNRGTCDTKTGLCNCHPLFTGSACQLLKCPTGSGSGNPICSGHGTCKTMEQMALASAVNGVPQGFTYGATVNNPLTWDFNKIQACDCSQGAYLGPYSGAFGDFQSYDCSTRYCPLGADPFETGKVNEIQSIACLADGGSFKLTFRQQTTQSIAWNANAATLRAALQALTSISTAIVTITGGGAAVCAGAGAITTTIEFTYAQGDLPPLVPDISALTLSVAPNTPSIVVAEVQPGTKANLECSSRGECDGAGNPGVRGDCGYKSPYATIA
ncbi:hypothetical protein P43SY_010524 [Pythium insidiosum]|uniref:EGF-like domain-containing protein n=1 Tax=Pythium insidiosum TaxID=114742 RepID=A0AAD5Q1Q9_PYTIN|nr:hypothetical protein P43SY_010524 [Pythium insidiosum]